MHFAAVGFFNGTGMQTEEVDLMFFNEVEDGFEVAVVFKPDTHFNGESTFGGLPKTSEDCINFFGLAEEAATDVFLVYFGCGAPHV